MSNESTSADSSLNVFINCPYDDKYAPIMDAILFAIIDCGYFARCALEINDGTQNRLTKICRLMQSCSLGVHDISRIEVDPQTHLPRFNMPFELGLFFGASVFASKKTQGRAALILDAEEQRYRSSISDLAGQDISAHRNRVDFAISQVRDFLQANGGTTLPGGRYIYSRYIRFREDMPVILKFLNLEENELTFLDRIGVISEWLQATRDELTLTDESAGDSLPASDAKISAWKREKLRLKDEMAKLQRSRGAPRH